MTVSDLDRRRFLAVMGIAGATALAGCSDGGGGDGDGGGDGGGDGDGDGNSDGDGDGDGGNGDDVDWPDYVDGASRDTFEDLRGEDEVTIEAGSNYFDPTRVRVDAGTDITWEFVDAGHNVEPQDQPGDDMEGTPGGSSDYVDEGGTHSETLEETGMYTYYCVPHEALEMKGAIQVE